MPAICLSIVCAGCWGKVGGGGGDDGDDGGDDAGPAVDADPNAPDAPPGGGDYFPAGAWMYQNVEGIPPAANSATIIGALRAAGGWGNGDTFQIDFSIEVLTADAATPRMAFDPTGDFYSPDCDQMPVPVPAGGNLEGEDGYECVGDGDCHLIVHAAHEQRLYEMWRANIVGAQFDGGCLAVWNTDLIYPDTGRGEQCTSADAAGFPIAPLLFTADEVAAGAIDHAIRFILPNDRTQEGYVRPATHGTHTSGGASSAYYGVHLRLRADYPLDTLPSDGARVVARALQRYGMYHADGGNIALTAQSDRHTTAKWTDLLRPQDLDALVVEDFDVIDHGPPIELTLDCVRN